jgi:DNA/RNA-binding domain of Phe-tRNA-synthetase-like protein
MRRGEIRPLPARHAAGFLWSAWKGILTLGRHAERARPGDDAQLRAVIEAGLRIVVGGLASDRARESDEVVRAILESSPVPTAAEPADDSRLELRKAAVAGELRAEFPELAVWTAEVPARAGHSPGPVERRLAAIGERFTGASAIGLRSESTPWAYRVFFRQLGIDPDERHSPLEELALRSTRSTPLESKGLPDDALLIAVAETGVPVFAFDAEGLDGDLWLRPARAGERLGGNGALLADGRAVIADRARPVAVLFGEPAADVTASAATERMVLVAVQVKGVPDLAVEEALWTVVEILRAAD